MVRVTQTFESHGIPDVEKKVREQFARPGVAERVRPGQKIAVAVGSRGIDHRAWIVEEAIAFLRGLGAEPFIVPAMGSHGGATAKGQRDALRHLGISETEIGSSVVSSMEVVQIGQTRRGIPVFMDREASRADMVLPVARIKPHTDFKGAIESGLCKMLAIGLGKHEGCSRLHQEGFESFPELIPEVARVFLEKAHVGFGLALVEDAYDKTALVETVMAEDLMSRQPQLLLQAKKWMPEILVPDIDVLVVEEIGKEISGAGMDSNIIGRTTKGKLPDFNGPAIQRIVVLDLSEETCGNACGIGLADFTTVKAFHKIGQETTIANVIASGNPEAGRIPVVLGTEEETVRAAISCCARINTQSPKVVRIRNTLHLHEIFVSENMIPEMMGRPGITFPEGFVGAEG
jgi:hypothetical protein